MKKFLIALASLFWASIAQANVPCSVPFNLLNGTTADATQVMANYNAILTCLSTAAIAGTNNDITSLNALTTPITPSQGGTNIYVGGTSTGTGNAQVVSTPSPAGFSLLFGKSVIFKAAATNTGATTINVGALGATNVFTMQPAQPPATLSGGEIQNGQLYWIVYDGTQFILMNPSPRQATRTLVSGGTVVNSDDQARIVLGGGAFFTLVFSATGSYADSQFWVDVINSDTGAGKLMTITGGTNFYLYPGQIKRFFINGANAWAWTPAFERWKKGGAGLFADISNGNDGNDCLAAGTGRACQHICAAINRMYTDIDNQNSAPTVNVAAGTYTESCALVGQITGVNVFNITASSAATWKPNGTSPNLFAQDGAEVIVNGPFTFDNNGGSSGVTAMAVHQTGILDINNGFTLGTYSNGTYFGCDHGGGSINLPATFTINGSVGTVLGLGGGCSATWTGGGTVTINGGSTCSTFVSATGSGANLAMGTVGHSGSENGGCTQYSVSLNASLSAGGSGVTWWGGVGGSTGSGGQFSP